MPKFNSLLAFAVAIVLLALPASTPLAEDAADLTLRQQAVQRFAKASGTTAYLARVVRKALRDAKPAAGAPDPREFENELTPDNVERRIVPVLARHLDIKDASELEDFLKSPYGANLTARFGEVLSRAPLPGEPIRPSAADKRVADQFALTKAAGIWTSLQKRAEADLGAMWRQWGREVGTTRQMGILARLLADPEAPVDSGEPPETVAFMRSFARILRDTMQEMRRGTEEYEAAATAARLAERTRPEMLVAPEQATASRQTIVRLQAALTKRQAVVETALENATRRVRALPAPSAQRQDELRQGIELAMERNYALFLEFGENQRRLLDLFDRIFALAETHQKNLTVQDGKLLFPDSDSLATFRDLARQIREEADREAALSDKARQLVHPALRQSFDAAQNSHAGH